MPTHLSLLRVCVGGTPGRHHPGRHIWARIGEELFPECPPPPIRAWGPQSCCWEWEGRGTWLPFQPPPRLPPQPRFPGQLPLSSLAPAPSLLSSGVTEDTRLQPWVGGRGSLHCDMWRGGGCSRDDPLRSFRGGSRVPLPPRPPQPSWTRPSHERTWDLRLGKRSLGRCDPVRVLRWARPGEG